MSATCDHFKGKVILVATLQSKPGKGDELQRYLMDIHAFSNSPSEPGCLTFRVTRSKVADGDKFVIFEEYADKDAAAEHFKSRQFNALANAIPEVAIGGPILEYFEECPSN